MKAIASRKVGTDEEDSQALGWFAILGLLYAKPKTKKVPVSPYLACTIYEQSRSNLLRLVFIVLLFGARPCGNASHALPNPYLTNKEFEARQKEQHPHGHLKSHP